ncbi:MAG: hypothetical protein HKN16_07585, partial [Saprospiraceae bacterium]|nr:hypothetical protein [Saprospiraceae bacterium]
EQNKFGNFRSIHPDQDSLNFQGKTAFYDLKTSELKIGGVPFVKSCDAFIHLGDGNIEVNPGGAIGQLSNCRIVADTITKYHVINRATVNLKGRKEYTASGFYEYNVGNKEQEIEFKDIVGTRVGKGKRSEKAAVTRAAGVVSENENFLIDDAIVFQGKISLSAEKKNLDFDGFAKLQSPVLPRASWFSMNCEADKKKLSIPFEDPKAPNGQPLGTGIYLSKETAKIYPSFLMPLYFRKDRPILLAMGDNKGYFKHDKVKDELRLGDSTAVFDPAAKTTLLTLNNKTGKYTGTGKLNLGSGLQQMSASASGVVTGSVNENTGAPSLEGVEHDMDVTAMVGFDFEIPDKLLKVIITDLQSSSFDARPIDYSRELPFYERALIDFVPNEKDLKAELIELKDYGMNLDAKYNPFEFLFSKLDLKWDAEYQSFYNEKNLLALTSISAVPINRLLEGFIEIKMPTNGDDRMYIYLKSPSEDWYYFSYKGGILSTVSSSTRYNDILIGMKPKELSFKRKNGEFYEIQPINPNSAQLFVNRIRAIKSGQ